MSLSNVAAWLLLAAVLALLLVAGWLWSELTRTKVGAQRQLDDLKRQLSGLESGRDDLERLSWTDPLTGIWNYRYLQDALARELDRARCRERRLAVLMLDLDHFRRVNDAFGHQRGSVVLRELAERIALEIRQPDTFARYGGEEFVLVLPDTGPEGASRVAERICYVVRRHQFDAESSDAVRLTVSIGGALYPSHGDHAATLLRRADEALAAAKRAGCDQWHIARDTDGSSATAHVTLR